MKSLIEFAVLIIHFDFWNNIFIQSILDRVYINQMYAT